MDGTWKEFGVRKYAISAWFALLLMCKIIQSIGFQSNRVVILAIQLLFVLHLIVTFFLARNPRFRTTLLSLPFSRGSLIGLRKFFAFWIILSILSVLYALHSADPENSTAMHTLYVVLTALLSYDMLTFIIKFEREGQR